MAIEKTLLAATGVVLVGYVGYKIIEKENPKWIRKTKEAVSDTKKSFGSFMQGAKESFDEGYASA